MRIVVLDGHTLNPGDLSWDELKGMGECDIYERSTPAEVLQRLSGATIGVTNKAIVAREAMEGAKDLRFIAVTATGVNIVDVGAAKERGIIVSNVPAYGTYSVAQATFALLLELTNRVGHHAQTVRDGRWSRSPDFCYWDFPLIELAEKTIGIIGFGRIGRQVGKMAQAFGMKVIVFHHRAKELEKGIESVGLEELLGRSDVVSLHCPLTPETKGIINRERLKLMKKEAFLLNTSRGPLIVEEDLANALQQELIGGAGLDVLTVEPPHENNPLFKAPNCYITPHIAWATRAARERLMKVSAENVRACLEGKPQNVVNA
jgi:glycerate dehydrogenase